MNNITSKQPFLWTTLGQADDESLPIPGFVLFSIGFFCSVSHDNGCRVVVNWGHDPLLTIGACTASFADRIGATKAAPLESKPQCVQLTRKTLRDEQILQRKSLTGVFPRRNSPMLIVTPYLPRSVLGCGLKLLYWSTVRTGVLALATTAIEKGAAGFPT